MCDKCKDQQRVTVNKNMKGDEALIAEFLEHYRPMFANHKFEVIVPALVELIRERVYTLNDELRPESEAADVGQTLHLVLPDMIGASIEFMQLALVNGTLMPLHVATKIAAQEAKSAVIN
jgi:hypothetical protein